MKLVILQSSYLPWSGYFDQMTKAGYFIVYDDVQYDKHGWRNRNRIKTPQGIQWLTVPVLTKGKDKPLLKDVLINNDSHWAKDHLKSIKQNYSKAPFFKDCIHTFDELYAKEWKYLIDIDMAFILALKDKLGIATKIMFSSDMEKSGDRIQRLIDICLEAGATEFIEGAAGKSYLAGEGEQRFKESGINIVYQDYKHPVYNQLYGDFVPYLSVIDLLFNEGDKSLGILSNA